MLRVLKTASVLLVSATFATILSACNALNLRGSAEIQPQVAILDTVPAKPLWQAPSARPIEAGSEENRKRLMYFAEVWNAARLFSPAAVTMGSAWDTVFLKYADSVRLSETDARFAAVVNSMLGELNDGGSRVVGDTASLKPLPNVTYRKVYTEDSVLLVRPVSGTGSEDDVSMLNPKMVVLDLRADSGDAGGSNMWRTGLVNNEHIISVGETIQLPMRRRLRQSATKQFADNSSNGNTWTYTSSSVKGDAKWIQHSTTPIIALVNDATLIPASLFSLYEQDRLLFVSTGSGALNSNEHSIHVSIGSGYNARIRTEEIVLANGKVRPMLADTIVVATSGNMNANPDTTDSVMRLALDIVRSGWKPDGSREQLAVAKVTNSESEIVTYPSHPERLLSVSTLWGTARAFNPYLPMADESWDEMFERAIAEVLEAASAREYSRAIFRFVAALDASQAKVTAPDHPEFGKRVGRVPFKGKLIDKRLFLEYVDDSVTARSGLSAGDEVLAIGGEPIEKRLGRLSELVSASNAWSRDQLLLEWLESGPALVKATLRVRSKDGAIREMDIGYEEHHYNLSRNVRKLRVDSLSSGIAQVFLGQSEFPLPDFVSSSKGIVVDARGINSVEGLDWIYGSVLDADGQAWAREEVSTLIAHPIAGIRTPELDPSREFSRSELSSPFNTLSIRDIPVAILVDASTFGQGELLALRLLSGGGNRVLIGSPTAGAVGEIATVFLPGGIQVNIPVSDVRYVDGRFIQRLGLAPQVLVAPSSASIASGQDAVLAAAQRWILQQTEVPAPARRR